MSIINTIKGWYGGGGSPTVYFVNNNMNIAQGNTTVSCPVGSNVQNNQLGIGAVRVGFVRVKVESNASFINTGNVYPNQSCARVIAIIGDDANSNQLQLYGGDTNLAVPNTNFDQIYEFNTDMYLQNVNVLLNVTNTNAGTANYIVSVEVAAGP